MENIVKGCKITVREPVFGGSYRSPKLLGQRTYTAVVVNDSYSSSNQHTFTIQVLSASGFEADSMPSKTTRKGRNIYPNLVGIEYPEDYEMQAELKEHNKKWNDITNLRIKD
jgi:hypothetical protein